MHIKSNYKVPGACLCMALSLSLASSCKDDYIYDDKEPDWLGSSVYDYLQQDGRFRNYLALIDGMGEDYKVMLSKTGSKTMFPADDAAYARYFERHGMKGDGVTLIHAMSAAEKRRLFNSTMLNMAYLDNMLGNVASSGNESMGEGLALRHAAAASYLDSIADVAADRLPATSYWSRFAERGHIYLVNNGSKPVVHFTPQFMATAGITESDWALIAKGQPYDMTGFYINGVHVQSANKNITCKNGYIHIADEVIEPLDNMAELVLSNPQTSLFGSLMDKFSAPYYLASIDDQVHSTYGDVAVSDSVFVKRYFNDADLLTDPAGHSVSEYGTLFYDPANNAWRSDEDMGVMFVPTDEAMMTYWNSEQGKFLRDVYGDWQNVPTDVLAAFLKNHQRRSFLSSLPHNWDIMTDENSFYMNVLARDIDTGYVACNGMVFQTHKVFPPIDYQCIYGPALTADSTKLMKSAIKDKNLKFYLYLRSLQNQYNLLIPTDNAMKNYRDPISWAIWANGGVDNREIWSFKMTDDQIYADVYGVTESGEKGAFKRTIGATADDQNKIKNRLNDILDMHIVVADNEKEPLSGFMDAGTMQYALTKGGTILKVGGSGERMTVAGGGDVEQGAPAARIVGLETGAAIYNTDNGHAFFIDRILQDPFQSVYSVMQGNADFETFFTLLKGNASVYSYFRDDKDIVPIFDMSQMNSSSGIGQVVQSFNNYRYTVLIPTAAALEQAFAADRNLWTWDQIDAENDPTIKKAKCCYLLNFLKYHFIDGIVPVAGVTFAEKDYETAARNTNNQFVRIKVSGTGSNLIFRNEGATVGASVLTTDPANYNILTRDYIVDNADNTKASQILASSRAVLHLVDHVVDYQNNK